MAKFCEICGKGRMSGNNVSHSNLKTRRSWAPNTHKIRVLEGATPVTRNVCTRCMRTGKFTRVF